MPGKSRSENAIQEDSTKRQERRERILDAAATLIERWGYRKTTIDDVARQAGVAKGTIYLHWKSREDLFIALLIREQMKMATALEQEIEDDPEGATLHSTVKHSTLATLRNPLLKALMLQDTEVLGELVHSPFGLAATEQKLDRLSAYFELLRQRGLMRTDLDLRSQLYIVTAIIYGFMTVEQILPDDWHVSLEENANLLAAVIHNTFEIRSPTADELKEVNRSLDTFVEQGIEQARAIADSIESQ